MNETIESLFKDLQVKQNYTSNRLEKLAAVNSRYLKDLKLNVTGILKSNSFSKKESALLSLSVAINDHCEVLIDAFETIAKNEGATEEEIAEIYACTSLLSANNVFYRFRHYLPNNSFYNSTPAGIRMSVMMNPVLGKEFFELTSLVVSALNGCELCVTSHEASVKEHGASEARIYDAIKLAAIIRSLIKLV